MPSRRRLPTVQEYRETRRPVQKYLTPQNHTIRKRYAPLSTPRQRQQTLTQINYIYRVPMEEQDADLTYLQQEPVRERKRRKTTPEKVPTATVQTRSATRQALKQVKQEDIDEVARPVPIRDTLMESTDPTTADKHPECPQLPKTPRTIRKTEIPSSQSPADTPLSERIRSSARQTSRSPLKSKSANARGRPDVPSDTTKRSRQNPNLEIQDTFDFENWDSEPFTQSHTPKTVQKFGAGYADVPASLHFLQAQDIVRRAQSGQMDSPDFHVTSKSTRDGIKIKTEIRDSDDEDDDSSVEGDTNTEGDPRAPLDQAKLCSSEGDIAVVMASQSRDVPPEQDTTRPTPQIPSSQAVLHSSNTAIKRELTTEHSIDQVPSSQKESPEAIPLTPPPTTPTKPRSESQQASAQLATDLDRLTQPRHRPVVETDSQFEDAWRNFSPAPAFSDPELPSTTQPYHHTTRLIEHGQDRIPTSQATTVDITQTTPRAKQSKPIPSSQIQVLQSPAQPGRIVRLPFPPLPLSSSPIGSSPVGASACEGKVLTESQLLPDSLMNFTVPHPPSSSLAEESLEVVGEAARSNFR